MMKNEIILFKHDEFGKIRTLNIDGEPWFVGKDVAEKLGYVEAAKAIRTLVDKEDKGVSVLDTPGGQQKFTIINESGLYSLFLSNKLPSAKRFKHWVTSRVLPSLRKHGAYITAETLHKTMSDPRELAKLLTTLADEQDKRRKLEEENAFLSVKAKYYDRILQSKNSVPVTQIAKDYQNFIYNNGNYTTALIKVINPQSGEVDRHDINFCDAFGCSRKQGVHIWSSDDGMVRWCNFTPNTQNYEAINRAVGQYLEMFLEPVQNMDMSM